MLKYEYIFCDLDGTLLDDSERHYRCYCDIVAKYGGKCIGKEEYWLDKRNKVKRTILLKKTEFQGSYDDYINTWNQWIEQEKYLAYEVPKPYMEETLKLMKTNTSKLILVTMRQSIQNLEKQLEKLEIYDYFDQVIKGDPTKQKKADLISDIYDGKVMVIGDTEADQQLAQKIDGIFIAVTSGLRDEQCFEKQVRKIKGLDELSKFLN